MKDEHVVAVIAALLRGTHQKEKSIPEAIAYLAESRRQWHEAEAKRMRDSDVESYRKLSAEGFGTARGSRA